MLLTVAVCTRNRAGALRKLLTSLAAGDAPTNADWELVVVDNGSSDDTPHVLSAFANALPLRPIVESTRGLSHARNAAVREARGEYILWTDDDCLVDGGWLAAYADAVTRWPNAAILGGPIVPRFEGDPPAWLLAVATRVGTAFAARDFGREPIVLSIEARRLPFGANYAVRAAEQRAHLYDDRLGRGARFPIAVGEESEVVRRVLAAGGEGRWVPDASVTHCIPEPRQRIEYLRDYFEADGAYEEWRHHQTGAEPDDGSSSAQLRYVALRSGLRYQWRRRTASPALWIDDLIAASVARGRLRARRALLSPRALPPVIPSAPSCHPERSEGPRPGDYPRGRDEGSKS